MSFKTDRATHVRALANFRGTSYEEAEEWLRTEENVMRGEAKMLGQLEMPMAEDQNPMFDVGPVVQDAAVAYAKTLFKDGPALFKARPKLEGLTGDALVEATEVLMTTEPGLSTEGAEALGKSMAAAIRESLNKEGISREVLGISLLPVGKGSVIAENGVLLPCPRPTTPQEDYDNLVADTERKMTADMFRYDANTQRWLNAAAGIPPGATPATQVVLASFSFLLPAQAESGQVITISGAPQKKEDK